MKESDHFLSCVTWSVNYEWYWEIAIWSCADTLYFMLRAEKVFFMKTLLTFPRFHEKTLSRPGDIKVSLPGRRMYLYNLPPFMDALFSDERQLMKW